MLKSIAIAGAALLLFGMAGAAFAECGSGHTMQTVSTPPQPTPVATTATPVVRPSGG